MRGRRYGFNIEKDGKWIDAGETITAHSLYHWNNVYENVNYVVVQINDKLYIYPDDKPHSQQNYLAVIDLSQYATLTLVEPVSMTSVSSSLFVVGRWITPIVIETVPDTTTFTVSVNNPKFRDFNGVEDGYAVDYLPTSTEGLTSRHRYNLINQGWEKEIYDPDSRTTKTLLPDGLGYNGLFFEEYAAKYGSGRYPANNMQWFLGKQNSGKYNTTDLLNTYFGNTPAPKGHFIIDYLHRDRSLVSGINIDDTPAQTGINYDAVIPVNNSEGWAMLDLFLLRGNETISEGTITIPQNYKIKYSLPINTTGTLTSFSWGFKDNCKDVGGESDSDRYIRLNVEDMNRTDSRIVNHYILSQPCTMSLIGVTGTGTEVVVASTIIQPTGKMFSARGWDFTVQNPSSYTRYEIHLSWPNLDRSHKWLVPDTIVETLVINEINYDQETEESYEGLPSSDLLRGAITDIESFGGRLFYLCGNTVLFSQTLSTNNKNFDKCYQDADPTSEEVSDVVATDGGMIQLLSLGRGKALKSFYRGVIVFGDEEVTGVLSNYINLFSANDYDVVKITNAGLTSKYSVVETDSNVFYWSNHGIYMIGIDENNNISSTCISFNTIQNWYLSLSQFARDNCVGYYDYANNRIYWFYPTTNNADKLDGCLVYDLTYNSFMPQYVDSGKVVRDLNGNFAGILSKYNDTYVFNNKSYKCSVVNNIVYDTNGDIIGYKQDKFLTDCQESSSVYEIQPTVYLRAGGNRVVAGDYKVLASADTETVYDRKSAGIFLVSDGTHYSFGDFNDREFRDWDVSPYESYLVSRPITLGDTYFNKQTPVMQTLFKRTETYKLKDAPTTTVDLYNVTYPLITIINTNRGGRPEGWVGNVYQSVSKVLNKGVFKKTVVNFDLTNYSSNSTIMVDVRGYTQGSSRRIATTTEYAVAGNQIKTVELDTEDVILDPTYEYDSFEIITYITSSSNSPIRVFGTLDIHRNDLSEEIFDGYDEKTYTGTVALTNLAEIPPYAEGSENVYEGIVTTDMGYIKDGTLVTNISLSPRPHFNSNDNTPSDNDSNLLWYATEIEMVAGNIHTGINGIPDSDNRTITNSAYITIEDNTWKIAIEDLSYDTYYWRLRGASVNYTFTVLVPKYRKLSTALPSGYTTPSGAYIRMRWGWSINPLSNRWDMVQNGYRPQKDFLHDDYVESRLHIRGRGKAFQVEIRNEDNKDFRLTGLNIITRSPQ
jgi:hypothetical protein